VDARDPGQHLGQAAHPPGGGPGVGGVVGVEQHLGVGLGQRIAAGVGGGGAVLDVQQPGPRLLLQPLAGVAVVDAGPLGQLGHGRRPLVPQGLVQVKAQAQPDAGQLVGLDQAPEQPLGQGVAPPGLVGGRRGVVVLMNPGSFRAPPGRILPACRQPTALPPRRAARGRSPCSGSCSTSPTTSPTSTAPASPPSCGPRSRRPRPRWAGAPGPGRSPATTGSARPRSAGGCSPGCPASTPRASPWSRRPATAWPLPRPTSAPAPTSGSWSWPGTTPP